jgi:DNA-binding NtrC family response regulator
MAQGHILVVDDERDIRLLIQEILEDEGYQVDTAENGEKARALFAERAPDLVLLDIWMPDIDGISLLKEWSQSGRLGCPVVMISGHGTLETAVEATRLGAHDFIQKPLSLAKLLATVKQAMGARSQRPVRPGARPDGLAEPQGNSPPMQLLRQKAEQAARHRSPVLISGEPGSGKEALAAYLHRLSGSKGPFLVADAAQLAGLSAHEYLLGDGSSPGALGEASGGTLYLPELTGLGSAGQHLLSAIMDAGRYTPAGSKTAVALEARVMAGMSGDADERVRDGQLLEQLYLQLNVLALRVPALRERAEDVPELISHYADWYANQDGLGYRHFSVSALNRLRNHDWPGNERELRNMVQRLLIMGGEGEVTAQEVEEALRQGGPEPLGAGSTTPSAFDLPLREAREQFEREYLIYQLKKAGGSVGKLSDAVGMERTHLYRKLRSLGIDPKAIGNGDSA